jgi:predicted O-methyltransferase YrrM
VNYMRDRIQSLGYSGRTGHPCAYDALNLAARLVQPKSYLEIGVFDGGSLFSVLISAAGISRLTLCDLFAHDWISWGRGNGGAPRGSHAHVDKILSERGYHGQVEFLVGDSRELIPKLPREPQFDLIFVDGDHSHEAALADFQNVWPLLRVGGLLVMDDSSRAEIAPICKLIEEDFKARKLFTLDDGADTTTIFERVPA